MSRKSRKAPTNTKSVIIRELMQIDETKQHLLSVSFDAQPNNETMTPREVSIIDIAIIIISRLFVWLSNYFPKSIVIY